MTGTNQKAGVLSRIPDALSGLLGGGSTAVGLSIGTSSIKLVELKKAGKSWKLIHFGLAQLPENAVVNREIMNQIAVVDSLKTLIGQIKLRNKSVCTALSGRLVIIAFACSRAFSRSPRWAWATAR